MTRKLSGFLSCHNLIKQFINLLGSVRSLSLKIVYHERCVLLEDRKLSFRRLKAGEIPLEERSEDPEKKVTYLMPAMDFHQRRHESVLQEAANMDLVLDGKKVSTFQACFSSPIMQCMSNQSEDS